MKKNKTLNIVLICIIATLAVAFGVCKLVIPEQTNWFISVAWEWLNKPLPVVGVSILAVSLVLWRLFVSTSYGKQKYNELKERYLNLADLFTQFKDASEIQIEQLELEIEKLRKEKDEANERLLEYVDNIKKANPCKKVREIKYERKEETHD